MPRWGPTSETNHCSAIYLLITINPNALDIDRLVPLAEAWRSGAWAWTSLQRQAYANDLSESRALVAVSLGQNRSKVVTFIETIYASNRLILPLRRLLIIGY